jgi:cytochrome c biogenesis protein CcmG, thiol:disulfide interchange protein DsbE
MRRLLYLVPLLLFAGVATYFAFGLERDPRYIPSALIDKPAPAFDLPGLPGRKGLARSDLAGKVSLVNFFASWCVECRTEHATLMKLGAEKGVNLYGIAWKDKDADTERWLAAFGDPYRRVGVDADNRAGIDFGVYGVPETYVIDKHGRIRFKQVGPITPGAQERKLRALLDDLAKG